MIWEIVLEWQLWKKRWTKIFHTSSYQSHKSQVFTKKIMKCLNKVKIQSIGEVSASSMFKRPTALKWWLLIDVFPVKIMLCCIMASELNSDDYINLLTIVIRNWVERVQEHICGNRIHSSMLWLQKNPEATENFYDFTSPHPPPSHPIATLGINSCKNWLTTSSIQPITQWSWKLHIPRLQPACRP